MKYEVYSNGKEHAVKTSTFLVYPALAAVIVAGLSCASRTADLDRRADHALDFAVRQLRKSIVTVGDSTAFPVISLPDGTWKTGSMYDWRSGFFAGCLWYAWEYSGDETLKATAVRWTEALEPVKDYTGGHRDRHGASTDSP